MDPWKAFWDTQSTRYAFVYYLIFKLFYWSAFSITWRFSSAGRLHRLQRRHSLLHLRCRRWHRPQRPLCQAGHMVRLHHGLFHIQISISNDGYWFLFFFVPNQVRQRVRIQHPCLWPDGPHGFQGVNQTSCHCTIPQHTSWYQSYAFAIRHCNMYDSVPASIR